MQGIFKAQVDFSTQHHEQENAAKIQKEDKFDWDNKEYLKYWIVVQNKVVNEK